MRNRLHSGSRWWYGLPLLVLSIALFIAAIAATSGIASARVPEPNIASTGHGGAPGTQNAPLGPAQAFVQARRAARGLPPKDPGSPPEIPDGYIVLVPGADGNCPAPVNGGTTNVGCRFVLDLWVNTGSNQDATAEQSYFTFTYGLIQNARVSVITSTCTLTSTVTADPSTFDATLQNEVCNGPGTCLFRGVVNDPGWFSFASGGLNNCPDGCGGFFRVAQTGWCASAPGQALLHWQFSPPAPNTRDTEIVAFSGDIISDRTLFTDYVINIQGQGGTPTPTVTPVPPTLTPTPSNTTVPPTLTPTRTNTTVPATVTPTRTNTTVPPTATRTNTPAVSPSPTTPAGGDGFMQFVPQSGGTCAAPPNGGTVQVGCTFVLDLYVNTGSRQDATAQQSYLTFTYQMLQNARVSSIGTSCVLTSTVTTDQSTFDAALQNEVCNGPGTCLFRGVVNDPGWFSFASGGLNNCPEGCGGFFRVAQTGWCATAPGQALLHWQFSPPAPPTRDTELVAFNGDIISDPALFTDYLIVIKPSGGTPSVTPTLTVVSTATLTPTPTPSITAVPPTLTPTRTSTSVPPTLTPTSTGTSVPPTVTPTNTGTTVPPTLTPTRTSTSVPPTVTPTNTPTVALTVTRTPSLTVTSTGTTVPPTLTPTPALTATNTPTSTHTRTPSPTPINTATISPTNTPTSALTSTPTPTSGTGTPSPTPCGSRNDIVLTQWLTVIGDRVYATYHNTSTTCSNLVGIATYKRFNNNIEDQELFDSEEYTLAPGETRQLSAALPPCAYQADAFWGPVIHSFRGGVRYGDRLIDDILHNGGWCRGGTSTPAPTSTPAVAPDHTTCSLCDASISGVKVTCNADGTVHWSADVRYNNPECGMSAKWKAELQFTDGGVDGQFRTVAADNGALDLVPGDNAIEGYICHAFDKGKDSIRLRLVLMDDDRSCNQEGISPAIAACDHAMDCGTGGAANK